MREETVVKYIANDGTPFDTDSTGCQYYEALCEKYKTWLRDGTVMLWDHYGNFLNIDLCDWIFQDNTNYLDWLKKRLSTGVGYIIINTHPCSEGWGIVWEFVVNYCLFDANTAKKIEPTYCEGDLLSYDCHDCRFHNMDFVLRNAKAIKERLKKDITLVCKEHNLEV